MTDLPRLHRLELNEGLSSKPPPRLSCLDNAWNKSCASMAASGPQNKKGPMNTRSVIESVLTGFTGTHRGGRPMISNKRMRQTRLSARLRSLRS